MSYDAGMISTHPPIPDAADRFKSAVESNFDLSADIYDAFEERHGLFDGLASRLLELTSPATPGRVLDVGCGTGVSTLALARNLPADASIYGLDISEGMLVRARKRCDRFPRVVFVRGDAERLGEYFHDCFDAVFFNASIFLIPHYEKAISAAAALLVPGGVLALSGYRGFTLDSGEDAVTAAFPQMKYRFGTVTSREIVRSLDGIEGVRSSVVEIRFETSPDFLFDFLSIPAQSAAIFPKTPYIERIPLVRDFCDELVRKDGTVFMAWDLVIGRKGRVAD